MRSLNLSARTWLIWHIAFWTVYVLVNAMAWSTADNNSFRSQIISEVSELPFKLPVVYFNLYYLMPRFLFKKRRALYFLLLFLCYLAGTLLMRWNFLTFLVHDPLEANEPFFKPYRLFKYFLFNINFAVIITSGISLFFYWIRQNQATQELKEQKHLAEINLLKSQINPHFLFNTLNNLYSLSMQKHENAPEMILRLSEIMRYMIYDASNEWVSLKDELDYLENYLAIERMRYGEEFDFSFSVHGDENGLVIAPLVLLPFAENIFKHGISKDPENVTGSISIEIDNKGIFCKFRNGKPARDIPNKNGSSGFGIRNVQKRLQLIYPGAHSVKIDEDETSFTAMLHITLKHKPETDESH